MLAAEKHKGTFLAPIGIGLSLFIAELSGKYIRHSWILGQPICIREWLSKSSIITSFAILVVTKNPADINAHQESTSPAALSTPRARSARMWSWAPLMAITGSIGLGRLSALWSQSSSTASSRRSSTRLQTPAKTLTRGRTKSSSLKRSLHMDQTSGDPCRCRTE